MSDILTILCPDCGVPLEHDGSTVHIFGCPLATIEHLIGEIADASHDDEDDRDEDIPAISVKDPTER